MINILHITPDFNYSCGRSKLVYLYLKYFSTKENYLVHFITNGGDSLDRIKSIKSLKYEIIKFSTGSVNIFSLLGFYKKIKKYVKENNIDLIHTHHRFPELISTKIAKKFSIKTITSAHSFVTGFKRSSFKSDKIISVSHSLSGYLIKNFRNVKGRMVTLYNPAEQFPELDDDLISDFRNAYKILSNQKVILFVGRIDEVKGIDTLLRSFEIVKERFSNVSLIINGQIENKKNTSKQLLKDLAGDGIIYILPRKDIQLLYSIANIVVLPSRIDPFPIVMVEAGTFKKPFIGGKSGGIAEFIEDGKNGLLINPENPQELAEKIIYVLGNPDTGKTLGENLHKKVNKLCDYNNYFLEVENIYNSLLSS